MKQTKSIVNTKKSYSETLEIAMLNTFLKTFIKIKNGEYKVFHSDVATKLDMEPFYQRDFVWTLIQKKLYIENIFLGLAEIKPTIVQYIDEDDVDVWEVLDGKQRLNAIFEFVDNRLKIFDDISFDDLIPEDQIWFLKRDVRYKRVINKKNLNSPSNKDKVSLFLEQNYLGTKVEDEHLLELKKKYFE